MTLFLSRRRVSDFLIILVVLACLPLSASAGDKSFRVAIPLEKRSLAQDAFVVLRVINTADLTVQTAQISGYASRFNVHAGTKRSLLAVTAGSFSKATLMAGLVKVNPKARALPSPKLRKRKAGKSSTRSVTNFPANNPDTSLAFVASSEIAVVALRDSDFTITGPETQSWMALAGRDVIATAMAAASCYRHDDGFIISETSTEFFRARAQELALCRSGLADQGTCFSPQSYTPPNSSVRGIITITSDGTTAAFALSFFDESGSEAATTIIQGPFEEFISLAELAGGDLGQQICAARDLRVSMSPSGFSQNNCAYTATGGCGCSETQRGDYWEGGYYIGEMKGPVNSLFEISSSLGEASTGTISCGSWSKGTCSSNLCCRRDPGQPALAAFDAQINFPPIPHRICACANEEYQTTLGASVRKGSRAKSVSLAVRCPA